MRWLTLEHLTHQVVGDMAVIPGERPDERGRIGTPDQREGGKIQAGSPSFGASVQQVNICLGQVQPRDRGAKNLSGRFDLHARFYP